MKEIIVLRYGHRFVRDKRVTTHCILTARAFGAKRIVLFGDEDKDLLKGINGIIKQWGGNFKVEFKKNWKQEIIQLKENGFKLLHATMYGEPIQKKIKEIRKFDKLAILIGSQKVPWEVYELADFNLGITSQPHSEISSLAIILHEIFNGEELDLSFLGGKIRVKPQKCGKKTVKLE